MSLATKLTFLGDVRSILIQNYCQIVQNDVLMHSYEVKFRGQSYV